MALRLLEMTLNPVSVPLRLKPRIPSSITIGGHIAAMSQNAAALFKGMDVHRVTHTTVVWLGFQP